MTTSPFLLYHKIDELSADARVRGAFTSPSRFEKQIRYLRRKGFEFLTASEMIDRYREDGRFPARAVSITFDDGWKDNYTNAFPILKKYGVKATIFIVPGVLDTSSDTVTADGEGPREHMSADNVREMAEAGIEMGSHSMTHRLLNSATDDEARDEITRSKQTIEGLVQNECRVFAYPAGFFTPFAVECVKDAGYSAALSTVYGDNERIDLFTLNRTEILRRDRQPFSFRRKIKPLAG